MPFEALGKNIMDEVLREFINEGYKNLEFIERDLSALQKQPDQLEPSIRLCRALHTIKGTSGMLGFPQVQKLTQAGESLLLGIRDKQVPFKPEHGEALLRLSALLENAFETIQQDGTDKGVDVESLTGELTGFLGSFSTKNTF